MCPNVCDGPKAQFGQIVPLAVTCHLRALRSLHAGVCGRHSKAAAGKLTCGVPELGRKETRNKDAKIVGTKLRSY